MQYGHEKAEYDVDFESVEKDSRERVNSKKVIEKWSFLLLLLLQKFSHYKFFWVIFLHFFQLSIKFCVL